MMQSPMRPARKGVSRAVPVVVSAGLAVGVFCGLLFGLGTGEPADAKPADSSSEGSGSATVTMGETTAGSAVVAPVVATAGSATAPVTAAGSGSAAVAMGSGSAAPAAGSGSAVAAAAGSAAALAAKPIHVSLDIDPASAAISAAMSVDGTALAGPSADVPAGTKQVRVKVIAPGFHTFDENFDIVAVNGAATVKVKLRKREATPPSTGTPSNGGSHSTKPNKPKPGMIDI
jgi:hypothetical protein